jgi:ankyrin repeat protein
LFAAVVAGKVELVEQLLRLGADPARRVDGGAVPLITAVVHGACSEILDLLLQAGADPRVSNDDGFGLLHAIAETNKAEYLPWAMKSDLDLEARTKHGHTPIQIAAALGHLDALRVLFEAGADLQASSRSGSAREIAIAEKRADAVALIDELLAS